MSASRVRREKAANGLKLEMRAALVALKSKDQLVARR
jgi:hypothetical protein